MRDRTPLIIDMTPGGDFVAAPPRSLWPLRIGVGAALVAAVAGVFAVAAVFLWIASLLVPVALVAGAIAHVALRLQSRPNAGPGRRSFWFSSKPNRVL